jgi:recombination protein RecR
MDILPRALEAAVEQLARLPGIGPKSAQRLAFHLLRSPEPGVERLSRTLLELKQSVRFCSRCAFISEADVCPICADAGRDETLLCVVEEPMDVVAIERTGEYRGRYHVLMGAISPMDGVGPGDIRLEELLQRLRQGAVAEVILATDGDVEGEATAAYAAEKVGELGGLIRVTRLARGLPMGAELEYADELTISRALTGRREM